MSEDECYNKQRLSAKLKIENASGKGSGKGKADKDSGKGKSRENPYTTPGGNSEPSGGQSNTRPTTRSQTQAQ